VKLKTKTRCGTRLVLDLARHQGKGSVQMHEISMRLNISVKYLEQLIRPLKQAHLVTSTRGPKGGHMLAKNPEEVTLGEITRLFEGTTGVVNCISNPEKCSIFDDCAVRSAWEKAGKALYAELDSITIADLLAKKID
jgi:Rrf2 family protein